MMLLSQCRRLTCGRIPGETSRFAKPQRRRGGILCRWIVLCLVLLGMPGCNLLGWGAGIFRPPGPKKVDVAAQYTDLAGKRVAVLVSADDYTLYRFPRSTFNVSETVSQSIATNVPDTTLSLPRELAEFQQDNPYWSTTRPSLLIDQLGVDRLILIDLNEYRTNEPGNQHVWRGVIDASFAVYEADSEDPDNRSFEQQVRAEFPENKQLGLISESASDESVEAAVLEVFALKGAGLFFDHKETRY